VGLQPRNVSLFNFHFSIFDFSPMLPLILILILSVSASAQTFSAFLTRVNSAPAQDRPAIVDSFMAACPAFPFIEQDTLCHYIYRGTANTVTIPGDANGWNPALWGMNRVSQTDFWYYDRVFESDARLDYKFVLNNSNWILDPRNPHQVMGGFGPNSELRMPDFVQPPAIENYPNIPHGALTDTMFASSHLGNTRRVRIYTPPGYAESGRSYPMLLVHDGLDYINLCYATRIFDYLIDQQQIEPLIAVFVPPVDRSPEYMGDQIEEFGLFVTQELLPFVDSNFRTFANPEFRGTVGASAGGNISLWLGVTYPNTFGQIAAQSAYVQQSITDTLEARADLPLRFYLDIGSYDIDELIPLVQSTQQILQNQNYPYFYQLLHDGHSWGNWRAHLDEALIYLFPPIAGSPEPPRSLPTAVGLGQNYPNPFNTKTTIPLFVNRLSNVTLTVYDVTGREVDTLANSIYHAGTYTFEFDASDHASGTYITRMESDNSIQNIKMIFVK
jgi:enterochelin esterase-like enzyme